jgi:hypothetical protein
MSTKVPAQTNHVPDYLNWIQPLESVTEISQCHIRRITFACCHHRRYACGGERLRNGPHVDVRATDTMIENEMKNFHKKYFNAVRLGETSLELEIDKLCQRTKKHEHKTSNHTDNGGVYPENKMIELLVKVGIFVMDEPYK